MKLSKKALTAMIAVSIAATTISATSIVQKMSQTTLEQEASVPASQETVTLQTDTVSQQVEEMGDGAETAAQEDLSKEDSSEVSEILRETAEIAGGKGEAAYISIG